MMNFSDSFYPASDPASISSVPDDNQASYGISTGLQFSRPRELGGFRKASDVIGDMTPLIDMIFLLLIFFLLTSLAANPSVDVELPESSQAISSNDPPRQSVEIVSLQQYRFQGDLIQADDFTALLNELSAAGDISTSEAIYIQADASISYGDLIKALDPILAAGFSEISFMVERSHLPL